METFTQLEQPTKENQMSTIAQPEQGIKDAQAAFEQEASRGFPNNNRRALEAAVVAAKSVAPRMVPVALEAPPAAPPILPDQAAAPEPIEPPARHTPAGKRGAPRRHA